MLNISKTRKFPDNYYDMYNLSPADRGKYLNMWFKGQLDEKRKNNKFALEEFIVRDSFWTLKKVDEDTSLHLYQHRYNPIFIAFLPPTGLKFKYDDKGTILYDMKAQICSIDDSSYGIWWNDRTEEDLTFIRIELMGYIDSQIELNGTSFINKCIELGADKDTVDYN